MSLLECKQFQGFETVLTHDPRVEVHRDVLFIPGGSGFEPGLYDRSRRLVMGSGYFRGLPSSDGMIDLVHGSFVSPINPDTISDCFDETLIFGSILIGHFGHFILGTLSRFWSTRRPKHKILVINNDGIDKYLAIPHIRDIFGTIGISRTDFITFNKPVRLREVIVPYPAFEENNVVYRAYSQLCSEVARSLRGNAEQPPKDGRIVYLSKSRLKSGVSRIENEDVLCELLSKRGVDIVFPETVSFKEQIEIFDRSRLVMGCSGSGLHTSAFSPRSNLLILSHGPSMTSNQRLIDVVNNNNAHYVYEEGGLVHSTPDKNFGVVYRFSNPKATSEALLGEVDKITQKETIRVPSTRLQQQSLISPEQHAAYLANVSLFTSAVADWMVDGDADRISEGVQARYGFAIRVTFETNAPFHVLSFALRFEDGRATFTFHRLTEKNAVLAAVTQRWVQTLALWRHLAREPFEGSITINLNDEGVDPGLALCSNRADMTLIPDSVFLGTEGYFWHKQYFRDNPTAWEDRESLVLWRGSTTGQHDGDVFKLPRVALAKLGKQRPDLFDFGITSVVQRTPAEAHAIEQAGLMAGFIDSHQFGRRRYLVNIDGNTSAWSALMEQLNSGGLVFKVDSPRSYRQWFYDRLKPWENFVPVKSDLSDLVPLVEYFKKNDELAKAIASEGQKLSFSMTMESELERAVRTIRGRIASDAYRKVGTAP